MKRTTAVDLLALAAACLTVVIELAAAPAVSMAGNPYDVCRSSGLSRAEFNRCVSAVYVREMRREAAATGLQQALWTLEPGGSPEQCLRSDPCVFNPVTGKYQECRLLTGAEECLEFGAPCRPQESGD